MKCEICLHHDARHKHHIQSKCFSGNNKKYNLANVCPNCHDNIHTGKVIIEGKFLTTNGYQIIWHYKNDESITGKLPNCFVR